MPSIKYCMLENMMNTIVNMDPENLQERIKYLEENGRLIQNGLEMALSLGDFQENIKEILPLDWDQTHTLNGTLTIGEPGSWQVGLIGRLGSGLPYTSNPWLAPEGDVDGLVAMLRRATP